MEFTGRPNTIKVKTSLFKKWVEPTLKLDGSNLDKVVASWEKKLEPNTVKSLLHISKEYVKSSSGVELDVKPHISRVLRSKQREPVISLSKEEVSTVLKVCKEKDTELYLPLTIAFFTGCRRGEVWGLLWKDVDLINNKILISKSYNGPTKNGRSRLVPISPALKEIFLAEKNKLSYNCIENTKVINKTYDPNPRLKRICKLANVRNITIHSARHSFATLALEAKRSPRLVSNILGHSSVSTTLNQYWDLVSNDLDLGFLPNE